MKSPYLYCMEEEIVDFPKGKPLPAPDMPERSVRLLDSLNLAIPFQQTEVSQEELNHLACEMFHTRLPTRDEAFLIRFNAQGVHIWSIRSEGHFYAVQTFLLRIAESGLRAFTLYESPRGERGLKLYLPPPTEEGFRDFKRIVDLAAQCKYNFIMLELGGALEYRTHPEINAGWIEYTAIMNEYPGKTLDVQNQFPWRKNSIHSENGGGKVLRAAQFLELAEYCRERCLEVIPEMPSLSHSDYLLYRHRELAERQEDPFPDTCCPENPAYHKLYFELLDEVIELLHPRRIHIGHDEYYSAGLCPRCRNRNIPELYARDINEIASYLRKRGIEPIIWGEKLLNSHWRNGEPIGGAASPATDTLEALPATFPAIGLLEPISVFHWYWNVDRNLEKEYAAHGMNYYFANFNPPICKDWERRISAPCAAGICVSNWGQTDMRTLQRNGVLYNLVYASLLMWEPQFGSEDYPDLDRIVFQRLYRFRTLPPSGSAELTVCHSVQTDIPFRYFFDGLLLDEHFFFLGNHVFRSGGREMRFPVIFGTNISNADLNPARYDAPDSLCDAWEWDRRYPEISGECYPERDEKGVMWYYCRYAVPDGCAELEYCRFEPAGACIPPVRLKTFHFSPAGEDFHPFASQGQQQEAGK